MTFPHFPTPPASQAGMHQAQRLLIFVDGALERNFTTTTWAANAPVLVPLYADLDPSTEHSISLLKTSEVQWWDQQPQPNFMTLHAFEAAVGATLASPPPPPARRLEFLGDSLTAGYGPGLCERCARLMASDCR